MNLWKRLCLSVAVAGFVSVAAAAALRLVVHSATTTYRVNLPGDALARIRAEEVADAKRDALSFATVIVPLTLVIVWWRSRRRDGSSSPQ